MNIGVVYSLNVPVPGIIHREGAALMPALVAFESVRDDYTLVIKRFQTATPENIARIDKQVRETIRGVGSFEVEVTGIDVFRASPAGPAPVVYFTVRSEELMRLHYQLCKVFDVVPALEADAYVPHITIARGGDPDNIDTLVAESISPISWTVTELVIWDARYGEHVSSIRLPA